MVTGGFYKSGHIIDIDATVNTSVTCKFDLDGSRRDRQVGKTKIYSKEKKLVAQNIR